MDRNVKLESVQTDDGFNDKSTELDASLACVKKNLPIQLNSQFDLSAVLMVSHLNSSLYKGLKML